MESLKAKILGLKGSPDFLFYINWSYFNEFLSKTNCLNSQYSSGTSQKVSRQIGLIKGAPILT